MAEWICYSTDGGKEYYTRDVVAESFQEAERAYAYIGSYKFIWAEPMDDAKAMGYKKAPWNRARFLEWIEPRLEALGLLGYKQAKPEPAPTIGPRKTPRVKLAQEFVREIEPQELANRAWAAVQDLCK